MSTRIAESAELVFLQMKEDGKVISQHDDGIVVECEMRGVINELFPEHALRGKGGRKSDTEFHTEISLYLKYSGNARLVKRPSPFGANGPQISQYWLASSWLEQSDENIINRARQLADEAGSRSDHPMRRILARATPTDMPQTQSVTVADGVTMTADTPIDTAIDPFSAVQMILNENAAMKAENTDLARKLADMTAQRDQLQQRLDSIWRLTSEWEKNQ